MDVQVSQVEIVEPKVPQQPHTAKRNKAFAFPGIEPNDVTAGWAASPVDTRPLGPH